MYETGETLSELASERTFAEFYEVEIDGQVRRAALLTGSTETAHDVVHDAFLEIFRRWDHLDYPGPYLNRAVLNRCRDHARSRFRRSRVLNRLAAEGPVPDVDHIADMLDGLSFNHRAVIVLRFYIGLNNTEIADVLGCAPGSVGPWLNRALQHLRKAMS